VFHDYQGDRVMYILDFFDKDKPCPVGIKECSELREKYFGELEHKGSSCSSCDARIIRDKYLDIIINQTKL